MNFKSLHNLDFEIAPWITEEFTRFKIGTCQGLWRSTDDSYDILAIDNSSPGNGHFEDVLQWFENSCKRDNKSFRILEVWNTGFKNHLLIQHGFLVEKEDNLIKHYDKETIPQGTGTAC